MNAQVKDARALRGESLRLLARGYRDLARAHELEAEAVEVEAPGEAKGLQERITRLTCKSAGVPSWAWICTQSRANRIEIRGPRGGRFVLRAELEALLEATTIRRPPAAVSPIRAAPTTAAEDADAAVDELAARRLRTAAPSERAARGR